MEKTQFIVGLWEPLVAELSSQVKLSALLSQFVWNMGHPVEFLLCLSYFQAPATTVGLLIWPLHLVEDAKALDI